MTARELVEFATLHGMGADGPVVVQHTRSLPGLGSYGVALRAGGRLTEVRKGLTRAQAERRVEELRESSRLLAAVVRGHLARHAIDHDGAPDGGER